MDDVFFVIRLEMIPVPSTMVSVFLVYIFRIFTHTYTHTTLRRIGSTLDTINSCSITSLFMEWVMNVGQVSIISFLVNRLSSQCVELIRFSDLKLINRNLMCSDYKFVTFDTL